VINSIYQHKYASWNDLHVKYNIMAVFV